MRLSYMPYMYSTRSIVGLFRRRSYLHQMAIQAGSERIYVFRYRHCVVISAGRAFVALSLFVRIGGFVLVLW